MIISTALAFAFGVVAGVLGFTGTMAIGVCALMGYVGAALIYGGIALSANNAKKSGLSDSPSYQNLKQTQTNPDLPLPLLYGTVKLAGNRIWQDDNTTKTIKRIVAFAEGEITAFEDIRLNDIPVGEISGIGVNKYYGTPTQEIDPVIPGANHAQRAKVVGGLRNVAYLAINVPVSSKISGNYNLTTVVKGRKIRVYTTPNNYTTQYSENPAWVMFDFLNAYNGLGLCLNKNGDIDDNAVKEVFDLESFIESAAFCDELIDGEPRFTFNMIFDSQTSARSLIDEIYRSCRGGLFTKNGKFQFKIDKKEPVSLHIPADAIVKGSETFNTLPSEEHYDILKCIFISPEHEWQKVEAFAEIPEYRDGVPIEHSVNIYSCTKFKQASRLSWYYVNSKVLQPYFGSFQTDYRVYDREIGDVITYDSLLMGLEKFKVKITSIEDDGFGTFTVNWRNYDERLYNDDLGSKEPTVLVSNLGDLYGFPQDVTGFNIIQYQNLFNFVWDKNPESNVYYEIREGESWQKSTVVATRIYATSYQTFITRKGLHKFWIKAFSDYNYSENAALDVFYVDSIPELNEVIRLNLLENARGTFEDCYIYQGVLKPSPSVLWQNLDEPWENEGLRYYAQADGTWGANVVENSSYTSQIYDVGKMYENIVSLAFNVDFKNAENSFVNILWRHSEDGENFTGWELINPGQYTFRYYQLKVEMCSPSGALICVSGIEFIIDVPDIILFEDIEITDYEYRLEYDFLIPPSIIATVNDDIQAYAVITEKKNNYAILKALNNSGQPVKEAKVSVTMKGY